MSAMQEIELKFQIPAEALEAVRTALARLAQVAVSAPDAPPATAPDSAPLILQAAYFDTPDRRLAQARSALRVRREGEDWVQTLKAAGSHTMVRVEDNQPALPPPAGQALAPRLSLHAGHPAEAALRDALGWDPQHDPDGTRCGLVQLYATDMRRTRVQLRVGVGTLHEGVVELALDEGAITAGQGEALRSVPVRELEIELLSGHPQAVIDTGREWVQRFGLWLDTQTKAHRGDRLARTVVDGDASAALPEVTPPRPVRLPAGASPDTLDAVAAWRLGLEACLAHVTAHMSELATLAAAPLEAQAPVAYQWRRGLRRLRALGRFVQDGQRLGHGPALPAAALVSLQEACVQAASLARLLGHWRDQDALAWLPRKLLDLGIHCPPLPPGPAPEGCPASPAVLAQGAQATAVCLDVLTALMHASAPDEAATQPAALPASQHALSARLWLAQGLGDWHARCRRPSRHFLALSALASHRLRRRARRLRDVLELYAPLWQDAPGHTPAHPHRLPHQTRTLARALDALGALQDETVALARYKPLAATDAGAEFACGWLRARRKPLRKKAQRALRRWMATPRPW